MASFNSLLKAVNTAYTFVINRLDFVSYLSHYKHLLKINKENTVNITKADLLSHKAKWNKFSKYYSNLDFKLFSRYIGKDYNILPEAISHNCIETILNPIRYRAYYDDKNTFDLIFPSHYLPKTILRCIDGTLYNSSFEIVSHEKANLIINVSTQYEGLIVKPTRNTGSGKGVLLFQRSDNQQFVMGGGILSVDFLLGNCGNNFILQEKLLQSSFLSLFNRSSINTLRMLVYRSVVDNQCRVVSTALRVGKTGGYLDNAHAGGRIVGVDSNGCLGKFSCNQYGEKSDYVNDIDLKNHTYIIPNFAEIKQFAIETSKYIIHHRCISMDIAIDNENKPRIIEFNLDSLGTWAWQFTIGSVFGDYTDEVIRYCANHKKEALKVYSVRN